MKFKNLDELIKFEENVQWHNAGSIDIKNYPITGDALAKYNRLKGQKYVGLYGNKIVTAVSDQFSEISVKGIAEKCSEQFGSEYIEKTYKEGIIRIYNKGVENEFGKMTPLVIYPANLGNMAVKIGLYHNARVCSNGLILNDGKVSQRIIHKLTDLEIEKKLANVSQNLGTLVNLIDSSRMIELNPGVQLAMIITSLEQNDKLISKAFEKYSPKDSTLWSTAQTVTYVSTHETKEGYSYASNAGDLIINKGISPKELVNAASYAYARYLKGDKLPNTNSLLKIAAERLNEAINQ